MGADLRAVGIVVSDMAASLEFYRELGIAIDGGPTDGGHVDVELEGGIRLMFDTEELMRSFDSAFDVGSGRLIGLEADPAERRIRLSAKAVAKAKERA